MADQVRSVCRRTVLRGVALVGGAALTACGDGGTSAAPGGTTPTAAASGGAAAPQTGTSSAPAEPSGGPPLAALEDVAVGTAVSVTSSDGPLLLVRTSDSEVSAYSAVCPHQGCTVAPLADQLVCPCHASTFDPASGRVLQGPAESDLTPYPVTVVDGSIVPA